MKIELDPQAQAVIDCANSNDAPSITDSTPEQAHKTMDAVLNMYGWEGLEITSVKDMQVPGPADDTAIAGGSAVIVPGEIYKASCGLVKTGKIGGLNKDNQIPAGK